MESQSEYRETRTCSVCGKEMTEGYLAEDVGEYYCSDKCLHEVMTEDEYNRYYEEEYVFWTEWY